MRLSLSLAALLVAAPAFADPPADATVAATVNGAVIRLADVDARVRRRPAVGGPLTAAQARQLRLVALDDLIDAKLVADYLDRHGPKPEPGELDRHLAAFADALKKQNQTPAGFAAGLGLTEAELRAGLADDFRFARHVEARATDAELRKYHAEHKDFFDRATVTASHVVARVAPDAPPGEWAAARRRLAAVRADIVAGKITFAEAARKHSVDPTASRGGAVGEIARRDTVMDEAFCRAAFALAVGEVGEPVACDFGVHLILVTGRKAGVPQPFDRVADAVRECYTEDVRRNLVAQLRKTASLQINVP